jgi:hypothetical protein
VGSSGLILYLSKIYQEAANVEAEV